MLSSFSCLPLNFYNRPAVEVARALIGQIIITNQDGMPTAVRIQETEAYQGEEDLACHARAGRTPRTAIMYGPPGRAYIYFNYGMHWLFNAVTGREGEPAAVLIRSAVPLQGLEHIAARRAGRPSQEWCSGPAKLTRALGIDDRLNGLDLTDPTGPLWIARGSRTPGQPIHSGPRIGIDRVPEPWRSIPWRFWVSE